MRYGIIISATFGTLAILMAVDGNPFGAVVFSFGGLAMILIGFHMVKALDGKSIHTVGRVPG